MDDPVRFLSGGKWRKSNDLLPVLNPYDGTVIGRVCRPTGIHLDEAVEHTLSGFEIARRLPAHQRYDILITAAGMLEKRKEEAARLLCLEAGKPIRHARSEVSRAVNTLTLSAEESRRIGGETLTMDIAEAVGRRSGLVRRFPVGPILGISPFNFPLNLVCHKVGPALAGGNSILLKPASATPLSALFLAGILQEAGLPAGMLNVLPCSGQEAEKLVKDSRFAMVTFTGSAEIGWKIKSIAGKKKVCLELGGNAAVIIESDVDLDYALERCLLGGYAYAGQVCISVQRILVHKRIYDAFRKSFTEKVAGLVTGDPLDEKTDVGPLIDEASRQRIRTWIDEAVAAGGTLLTGGQREGSVLKPAVLETVPPEAKVWREEAFAPLTVLRPYSHLDEAITLANDSRFGLQAGIFTKDIEKAFTAFREIEVGGVIVNDIPTFRVDHMPYGGVKDSGFGREGVKYALEEMTEPRLLVINHH